MREKPLHDLAHFDHILQVCLQACGLQLIQLLRVCLSQNLASHSAAEPAWHMQADIQSHLNI